MTDTHSNPRTGYLIVALTALIVLAVGLGRSGFWDGPEMQVAGVVTDPTGHDTIARPPLQLALARMGFKIGRGEAAARFPTALFAILATLALAAAVGSASDTRAGMLVGITYATLPLVFENSRHIMGWGAAQSASTIALAGAIWALWGRAGPSRVAPLRWLALLGFVLGALGGGWMLGALPVLFGVAIAVGLRWREEEARSRAIGIGYAVLGVIVGILVARAAVLPHDAYDGWTGAGPDSHAPATFLTYESLIELLGEGLFPWTGIVLFGVVRLLVPPPSVGTRAGSTATLLSTSDAWRESGVRIAAFCVLVLGYGFQSFYLQQFGSLPFITAAPLAIGAGLALRDAEREAQPWRIVTAGATFATLIVMRDYLLFPKSSYAVFGLPDGGPAMPSGATASFHEFFQAHPGASALGAIVRGTAPIEPYAMILAGIFIVVGLAALFQGAGPIPPFAWDAPYRWVLSVQKRATEQMNAEPAAPTWYGPIGRFVGLGLFAYMGWILILVAVLCVIVGSSAAFSHTVTTPARIVGWVLLLLPLIVLVLIYGVIILWNILEVLGRPGTAIGNALGSRIAWVLVAATICALVIGNLMVASLSRHLSARDVWLALRQVRQPDEPVARYGGVPNDPAPRLYVNFDVQNINNERDAVEWLRMPSVRHYLVVNTGAEVFPPLNRAFRRAQSESLRTNIPVVDSSNSNLFLAASEPINGVSHNPLDQIVMTDDSMRGEHDNFHLHGRYEGDRLIPEPARFDDAIEFVGYNLDTGGTPYVAVGSTFTITYHFHVLREVSGNQQVFVHLDGQCPRVNGDHDPANGKYPLRFWLPGDFIHDEQRLTIPGYCRAGRYQIFIGFFQGDNRMHVAGGDHDRDNRVVAANLDVR